MKPPFAALADLAWSQFWQVTVVALLVGVLVRLFCRKRPHLAYLVWLLVILKCLTPPVLSSPTGVFSWAQARVTTPPPRDAPQDAAVSTPLPADIAVSRGPSPFPGPEPLTPEAFTERKTATVNAPPPEAPERRVQAAEVLGVIWLCGSVVYAGIVIGLRMRWSQLLRHSSAAAHGDLASLVPELSKRLGVRRKVRLLVISRPLGPVAYGVLRPTVLLPALLLNEKSPRQIDAVLAHELVHVRRHDNLMGMLQLLAQAIWWFHPLVWWANRQTCRERERCCDEEVVARLGCEPGQYAQSLLDVLKLKHKLRSVFAFPGVRPGEITSKRIEEIMEPTRRFHRRTPRWCWLLTLAAAALILPGRELAISRAAEQQKPDEKAAEPAKAAEKDVASTTAHPPPALTLRLVAKDCSGYASISRDGKYLCDIVYTDGDGNTGELIVRELATGKERRITPEAAGRAYCPAISSDTKRVAYLWRDRKKEPYELHVIGLDGSGQRVVRTGDPIVPKHWSSDGKRILGIRGRWSRLDDPSELVWVSIADRSVHVIKKLGHYRWGNVELSPDGHYVAYNPPQEEGSPRRDIVIFALDDDRETALVEHPADDKLLGWTPDGKHIFFASDRAGTWDAWLVRVAEGTPQGWPQLVRRDVGDVIPKGFTRGSSYFYQSTYYTSDVYVATLDLEMGKVISGPQPLRHTSISRCPDWSPDGQYLAYCTLHPDGSPRIHIRSLSTDQERQLDPGLPEIRRLAWSPDGRSLVASWLRPSGEFRARKDLLRWSRSVYQIDVETGESTLLHQASGSCGGAELSPDKKALFYTDKWSMMVRDLESGQEKEIFEYLGEAWVAWDASADGKQLALSLSHNETGARLKTVSATGGEAKELFRALGRTIGCVAWTPDGHGLFFTLQEDSQRTELWYISAEGGEPQRLLDANLGRWYSLGVHPDGRRIAFSAGARKREMWLMENFLPAE